MSWYYELINTSMNRKFITTSFHVSPFLSNDGLAFSDQKTSLSIWEHDS